MDALVSPLGPGEEEPRHARIGLDIVVEQVVDGLVATLPLAVQPAPLDGRRGRVVMKNM
jgi:hypothetical protein